MKLKNAFLWTLLSTTLAACSSMAGGGAAPAKVADGVLTGPNGMTLYTFDKDVADSGKSACNGPCAINWPPLAVMEGERVSGEYRVIIREDGKKQLAFKGKPLYYWIKDQKPGDKTGEGVNNLWRTAKP